MTDSTDATAVQPAPRDAAATTLMAELERESARMARLRRELEVARQTHARLEAALEALAPALSAPLAADAKRRLTAARRQAEQVQTRERSAPQAALLEWLALIDRAQIGVGEAQDFLEDKGLDIRPTYAAGALHHLAGQGVVQRIRRGKYRINKAHSDLVALRLRALEADMAEWGE